MKSIAIIFFFLLFPFLSGAQVVFKTIVPRQPVIAGESFLVQYVIQGAENVNSFFVPDFKGFKIVTNPDHHTGFASTSNGLKKTKNTIYTLSPLYPGRYTIPGAVASVNGQSIRSNDVVIEVISKEEATRILDKETDLANSGSYLKPGEDPYKKISQNLFMKVLVNKYSCFVGEPVMATFKLYSRLQSKSDIVKNPGFYGFTVYDMISLADNQLANENINGQSFDVHTIRKVQLYPLQAGSFTIDAMQVQNQIKFSRSAVNKKTEQEITEGVLINKADEKKEASDEVFENSISTEPIVINVKPLLEKNKPDSFKGATGKFNITIHISKDKLLKEEEGILELIIHGQGNFIQIEPPVIQWPAGIEGFEPVVKDSLDKMQSPLYGTRIFRYSFAAARAGTYNIPAVVFSFFNPDSGTYKTISTRALNITVLEEDKASQPLVKEIEKGPVNTAKQYVWLAVLMLLLGAGGLFLFYRNKKYSSGSERPEPENTVTVLSIDEILVPAYAFAGSDTKSFCSLLHQSVWKFFGNHFNLAGSEMNKELLLSKLKLKGVNDRLLTELNNLLQEYETGMFTHADTGINKDELLNRTKQLLEEINAAL